MLHGSGGGILGAALARSQSVRESVSPSVLPCPLRGVHLRIRLGPPQEIDQKRLVGKVFSDVVVQDALSNSGFRVRRCRMNMAHMRQLRPDSGLGFESKVLQAF